MRIDAPAGLNPKETKCFNEIIKPQLEELYSYEYDEFNFKNAKIFVSKNKFPDGLERPNTKEIENILIKVPEKDIKFVSDIYLVSYHCKDNNNKEIKGRTLPIVYKIIIYPKAYKRLKIILTHEIGHLVFENGLTTELKQLFALVLLQTFPNVRFGSIEGYNLFIKEQFADSYDNFINNPKRLENYTLINLFFINNIK